MSSALSIAVGGINQAINRATQAATNIVNASSTKNNSEKNVDGDLVAIKSAGTDVAINATVIKTEHKMQKALLDILA